MDRLDRCVLLAKAVVVVVHVLRVIRHRLGLGKGTMLLVLIRLFLVRLLVVEARLHRILRMVMLVLVLLLRLAGVGRLPRGQPTTIGHYGGLMRESSWKWRCPGKTPFSPFGCFAMMSRRPRRRDSRADCASKLFPCLWRSGRSKFWRRENLGDSRAWRSGVLVGKGGPEVVIRGLAPCTTNFPWSRLPRSISVAHKRQLRSESLAHCRVQYGFR
jgi:hypothetical protein